MTKLFTALFALGLTFNFSAFADGDRSAGRADEVSDADVDLESVPVDPFIAKYFTPWKTTHTTADKVLISAAPAGVEGVLIFTAFKLGKVIDKKAIRYISAGSQILQTESRRGLRDPLMAKGKLWGRLGGLLKISGIALTVDLATGSLMAAFGDCEPKYIGNIPALYFALSDIKNAEVPVKNSVEIERDERELERNIEYFEQKYGLDDSRNK